MLSSRVAKDLNMDEIMADPYQMQDLEDCVC